jgi:anion-transporting  ArsA/GET3 family ATPase
MQESGSTYSPERSGAPRRGRFARRIESPPPPERWRQRYEPADPLEVAVEERLEEGLRAIEEQAAALMREIAAEMWRASGADMSSEQTRILNFLSRDQAIRSLIASSDDRFQAIAMRTARLEDALSELAESGRAIREAIKLSAHSIHDIAASPTLQGVDRIRSQLEQVEQHIAATFEHLDERDLAVTEGIKEHGKLIARETGRIVEALQGYAGAEVEVGPVAEQLHLMYERAEIQRRSLTELQVALERLVETRTYGLAQLIRSDSEALGRLIVERADMQETTIREILDERFSALTASNEEQLATLSRTTQEQVAALSRVAEEQVSTLSRTTEEQVSALTLALSAAIERSFARLSESVDAKLETLVEWAGTSEGRTAEHLEDRLTTLARMIRSDNRVLAERMTQMATVSAGADGEIAKQTLRIVKELQAGLGADVVDNFDRRFQTMSQQLHKETQSTAEAMVKVAEVLGEKVDRLSVRVDEGYGNDLQIVIDRMSDAIQAMSGRARRDPGRYDVD